MFKNLGIFLCLLFLTTTAFAVTVPYEGPVEVYFSPQDHVTSQILNKITNTKKNIYVLSYSFTSRDIANALIDAYKRGVHVELIIDGGQTDHNRTYADECMHAGIPTYLDTKYAIAHDKVMVFDEEIVLTGSFNFTNAAEFRNSENAIFLHDASLGKLYIDRYNERMKTTVPYK